MATVTIDPEVLADLIRDPAGALARHADAFGPHAEAVRALASRTRDPDFGRAHIAEHLAALLAGRQPVPHVRHRVQRQAPTVRSFREQAVVDMIDGGATVAEVAERLSVTRRTALAIIRRARELAPRGGE